MKPKELESIVDKLSESDLDEIKISDINFDTNELITYLSNNPEFQSIQSPVYQLFKKLLIIKYAVHYHNNDYVDSILGIKIDFPSLTFGSISSRHFFGIDELLIYDFYKRNRSRYYNVADVGANCGLHSKILCELGYKVDSFEPDEKHHKLLVQFVGKYVNNRIYRKAVSNYDGKAIFNRVINNTTGSYLNDLKNGYGPIERYEVDVISARNLPKQYDLIKMDIEGSEGDVLTSLDPITFNSTDFIVEISTLETRDLLWSFFKKLDLPVYTQKTGWQVATKLEDIPVTHREGSIFISRRHKWNQ